MQGIIKGKGFLVPRNDKIKDWTQRKSKFKKKVTKIFLQMITLIKALTPFLLALRYF